MLTLGTFLIISLCVATAGAVIARLFQRADRRHLFVVYGSPRRLIGARIGVWLAGLLSSVLVWLALSLTLPSTIALGVFFGFEAVVLDICGQRVAYVTERPINAGSSAPVPSPDADMGR